jgi:hypothetical protein
LPRFGRTGEGRETKGTSSTTDSGAASRTGVKTGLNRRESISRKTPEESSPVPASLKSESESESELESVYIRLISLRGTVPKASKALGSVPGSMLNYKK